jgi:hypothetical protein
VILDIPAVAVPWATDDTEKCYRGADIRAVATDVVDLYVEDEDSVKCVDPDALLVVVNDGTVNIKFALFSWVSSAPVDVKTGVSEDPQARGYYARVFDGTGTGEPLREMRHSYWGEADNSGYVFYPGRVVISKALIALGKWFD